MVPITRRRLLGGAVALLASTAGCGESIDAPATSTPSDPEPGRGDRRVPDHHTLRTPSTDPPVWLPDEDATTGTSTADPRKRARRRALVADAETADRLRFADADGAEAARRFVAETASTPRRCTSSTARSGSVTPSGCAGSRGRSAISKRSTGATTATPTSPVAPTPGTPSPY